MQKLIQQEVNVVIKKKETRLDRLLTTLQELDCKIDYERSLQKLEVSIKFAITINSLIWQHLNGVSLVSFRQKLRRWQGDQKQFLPTWQRCRKRFESLHMNRNTQICKSLLLFFCKYCFLFRRPLSFDDDISSKHNSHLNVFCVNVFFFFQNQLEMYNDAGISRYIQ